MTDAPSPSTYAALVERLRKRGNRSIAAAKDWRERHGGAQLSIADAQIDLEAADAIEALIAELTLKVNRDLAETCKKAAATQKDDGGK